MFLEQHPYVRLREAVFVARLTAKSDDSGEWRYAWVERAHSPLTGAYADADPGRSGGLARNYATEVSGAELPLDLDCWCRLKGAVDGHDVYEVLGLAGGEDFPAGHTEGQFTADQIGYVPPDGAGLVYVSSDAGRTMHSIDMASGRRVTFVNVGLHPIVFPHGSTTEGDQTLRLDIPGGGAVTLTTGDAVTFVHDGTAASNRNRMTGTTAVVPRPPQTASVTGASQNDFAVTPNTGAIQFTVGTADTDFTGIANGKPGAQLTVTNVAGSTKNLVLRHGSTASASGNRFDLPGGIDYPLVPGKSATLTYNPSGGTWGLFQFATGTPYSPSLSGTQNNYTIPAGATALIPTLSGSTTLTGLTGLPRGVPFVVFNSSSNAFDLTLSHASASSSSGNRLTLSGGVDLVLPTGKGAILLYDGSTIAEVGLSGSVAALTPVGPPPAAPSSLSASGLYGSASLSWSAPAGVPPATSYRIWRSLSSGMSSPTLAGTATGLSATVTGLTNGVTYYFGVTAATGLGAEGPYSGVVSVTPSSSVAAGLATETDAALAAAARSTVTAGIATETDAALAATYTPPVSNPTIYSTAGSYSFTVPGGVTAVTIKTFAGGGGGGGGNLSFGGGGGGGGGGSDVQSSVSVTPGEVLTVAVGAGGGGGAANTDGNDGNDTEVLSGLLASLAVSYGGARGNSGSVAAGGAGGLAGAGGYAGGSGATGILPGGQGGGGGGAAGSTGAGSNGSSNFGGNGGTGGGGNGGGVSTTPDGSAPGGGGQGGNTSSLVGGNGAAGRVEISW